MTDSTDALQPDTSAEQLAALAATRPDLWPAIVAHPNAYPALREWIAAQQAARPEAPGAPGAGAGAAAQPMHQSGGGGEPNSVAPVAAGALVPASSPTPAPKSRRGLLIGALVLVPVLALGAAGVAFGWFTPSSGIQMNCMIDDSSASSTAAARNASASMPESVTVRRSGDGLVVETGATGWTLEGLSIGTYRRDGDGSKRTAEYSKDNPWNGAGLNWNILLNSSSGQRPTISYDGFTPDGDVSQATALTVDVKDGRYEIGGVRTAVGDAAWRAFTESSALGASVTLSQGSSGPAAECGSGVLGADGIDSELVLPMALTCETLTDRGTAERAPLRASVERVDERPVIIVESTDSSMIGFDTLYAGGQPVETDFPLAPRLEVRIPPNAKYAALFGMSERAGEATVCTLRGRL